MQASQRWEPATRFIEIGTRHPLGPSLLRAGFDRYLHVSRSQTAQDQLTQAQPDLAAHSVVAQRRNVVRENNADVLVLGSGAALGTLRFRNLRHARFVALCGRISPGLLVAMVACWCHVLLGRLSVPQRVSLESDGQRLLVFAVKRQSLPSGARHYVPHALGLTGFLRRLETNRLRHVVLRWFESLPELHAGEDLDLLVDDEHLTGLLELLESGPGVQPCDVYSETGLPRSDFRKMPYFPPRLAKELLDGAVLQNELCRVPSPNHHLLSMIYHAVYHKGPASGIPDTSSKLRSRSTADHDYSSILANLAQRLGTTLEVTRTGLDAFLTENAWRPPRDMLLRLGKRNRWVRESLHAEPEGPEDRGLVTFVLRREAMQRGGLDKLVPMLESSGFCVLKIKVLADAELRQVANNIRGGNWGRGPWSISGGPPAAIVVAYDPQPQPLSRKQRKKFPLATNARVLEKGRIRDMFNEGLPVELHCNALHSSDNGREAWEYVALSMPEAEAEIRRRLVSWQVASPGDAPVLRDLTKFGRRTKIELIEFHGRLAVRKTFKVGCERFCRREERAMRELAPRVPQIPPLIEAGDRTVVYPYYDDVLRYERSSGWLLPVDVARQAILALRGVYEAGYALVDASIDNVLIDRHEGLKLIDFEFLYGYDELPASFAESYDIAGCPADFAGDLPSGGGKSYRRNWQPYVGLSLESLLHDPPWRQHLKRTIHVALRPHRYWPRRARFALRQALAAWRSRKLPSQPTDDTPARPEVRRAA